MFKNIRNRIMLLNMVMVSAVVIAAFTVIFIIIYTQEHDARRTKLTTGAIPQMAIAGAPFRQEGSIQVEPGPDGAVISGFARRIDPGEGLSFSLLIDSSGNIVEVNSVVNLPDSAYGQAAQETVESGGRGAIVELEGRIWQYAVSSVSFTYQETDGVTYIASGEYNDVRFLDVTDSDRMLESLGWTLSGLTVVILAAFFFISRLFANRAIHPMEEAFDKQSRFIADASHELKTPLSIINANCDVLVANEEETVTSQMKWVDSITRATGRMTNLADDLLSLARMEGKDHDLLITTFDLSAAVSGAISEMGHSAQKKELVVETHIEPGIEIESDKAHVLRILDILLDNAIKYTDDGGEVSVSLKREKRFVICTVRNSGGGIPKDDLPRLFDRFYRGDPARSSETEGYGLGLSIAKSAADQIGAGLTAISEPDHYTEFRLQL